MANPSPSGASEHSGKGENEKKTNMNHLQSLLNIPRILSTPNIENELERIAKLLMNDYCISNGKHSYRLLEIEFYIYDKDRHADEHVYERDAETGRIFFIKAAWTSVLQAVWKMATLVVSLYVLLNERMVKTSVVHAYALMRL